MICIDNSVWPPCCFSNDEPRPRANLLRQHSSEHCHTPTGQTKIPTVNTRVTPSRGQASTGLMLIPTKARGLLSGTMIRGTLTRGLNCPQDAKHVLSNRAREGLQSPSDPKERKELKEVHFALGPRPSSIV